MIHNVDPKLSQWDVGRVVSISDSEATHIDFANQGDSKAPRIKIENGSAKIPDYLLQTGKTVIAYAVKDGVTLESKSFSVRKRERPENYIYEDDQRNYIYVLITNAETAVANANTATENANVATGRANTAATNADVATNSANLATTKANTATDNANLAAKSANEAVTKANNAVKNMMVVGEAKGETIALNDAIDQTLVGLRVFGKTTQDGTPTPDAPAELVSVGDSGSVVVMVSGKNLISDRWQQGMLKTEDGTTLISNAYWITNVDYISVDSSKDYVLSADTPNSACVFWYDKNKRFISYVQPLRNQTLLNNRASKALVLPDYAKYARVSYNYAGSTEAITPEMMGVNHYVQLEFGSTATEYEPYKGQTLTISTSNGLPGIGEVCDEIDFARGVYVQRIGIVDMGTLIWEYDYTNNRFLTNSLNKNIKEGTRSTKLMTSIGYDCKYNSEYLAQWDNAIYVAGSTVYVHDVNYTTLKDFTAAVSGETLLYPFKKQIETPLSEEELAAYAELHTYRDHTTVSNDAGAWMELEYVMDAKKYIESLVGTGGSILPARVE